MGSLTYISYSLLDTSQLWVLGEDNKLKNKGTGNATIGECSRCNWDIIPKDDCPTWMHIKNEGEYEEQKSM